MSGTLKLNVPETGASRDKKTFFENKLIKTKDWLLAGDLNLTRDIL